MKKAAAQPKGKGPKPKVNPTDQGGNSGEIKKLVKQAREELKSASSPKEFEKACQAFSNIISKDPGTFI
jgi:hypothetical protein